MAQYKDDTVLLERDYTITKQLETDVGKRLKEIAMFTFPVPVQARLDRLMERNNEGELRPDEREELRSLVNLNELVSILKGWTQLLLRLAPTAR